MKKRVLIIIIIVSILVLSGLFFVFKSPVEFLEDNDINNPVVDSYFCTKNSDCVKVDAEGDCCGCNAGGKATAINKKFISEFNRECTYSNVGCPDVMSNDPSCFMNPVCEKEKCKLALVEGLNPDCSVQGEHLDYTGKCCEGLKPIEVCGIQYDPNHSLADENGCTGPFLCNLEVCSNCGDGVCDEDENPCNCEDDCR